ncbi:MAG: pantoate--beta-alanine ligase [Rhodospirillaceae bacterium]|nr:pantoate--beta-alanine ligase [Rhodospirillaceae bacterium]
MQTVSTVADLRRAVGGWHRAGERVAVVPTMGALHEGHLSLVRAALAATPAVVVTLFVNPTQFNSASDLVAYPRNQAADAAMLSALGVPLLYAPPEAEMYPDGFATSITVSGVSEGLCGAFRPGHFSGVATVVTKLLVQTLADIAFFGEKDFQQLHVIRRLVRDLDLPVEIVGCPIVREADGLALSSRNAHLSPAERRIAPHLSATLFKAAERIAEGAPVGSQLAAGRAALLGAGFRDVEYLELRAAEDLQPLPRLDRPARLLAAAWLGHTRLIDNVAVTPKVAAGRS